MKRRGPATLHYQRAMMMQNYFLRGFQSGKIPCRLIPWRIGHDLRAPSFRAADNTSKLINHSKAPFSSRPDPFARRPNAKCDPYDQGGKPLTLDKVQGLINTVEPQWKVMMRHDDKSEGEIKPESEMTTVPFGIRRVYWHDDYMQGAAFSAHVAAVAQMNAQHFPQEVILSRKLDSKTKTWRICTEVICRTHVLQGLSHHDFYLATLIDIEAQRPEVRGLLSSDKHGL